MVKTTKMLREELSGFSDPANKIARMVRDGELLPVIRGLYETDSSASPWVLAGCIYGPSYLSFESAMAYHGLIPEGVKAVTSATFEKGRSKAYDTPFGTFLYRDVPADVFPLGLELGEEGGLPFRVATAEKALCDKLYALPPVGGKREIEPLLEDDLRIDLADLSMLDSRLIEDWAERYRSRNVRWLASYLREVGIRA